MTVDEAKNAIEELKAQGLTDEGIAASLYSMYQDDKIDLDQFGALVKLVGYELSEEFMAMDDAEKKNQEVGEFGMNEDDTNNTDNAANDDTNQNDAANDNNSSNDDNNNAQNDDNASDENKDDEEENPFEKDYDKKSKDDDEEEAKKMFNF